MVNMPLPGMICISLAGGRVVESHKNLYQFDTLLLLDLAMLRCFFYPIMSVEVLRRLGAIGSFANRRNIA